MSDEETDLRADIARWRQERYEVAAGDLSVEANRNRYIELGGWIAKATQDIHMLHRHAAAQRGRVERP